VCVCIREQRRRQQMSVVRAAGSVCCRKVRRTDWCRRRRQRPAVDDDDDDSPPFLRVRDARAVRNFGRGRKNDNHTTRLIRIIIIIIIITRFWRARASQCTGCGRDTWNYQSSIFRTAGGPA